MAGSQQVTGQDAQHQQKLGELISQIFTTISKIDVGAEEENIGFPLDPKLIAQADSLDTLTLVVFIAERHRAKSASADMNNHETMMGKPGSKRLLRQCVRALLWKTRGMTQYEVRVRLPAGSTYTSFTEWLPLALAHVAKTDQVLGVKLTPPKLVFRSVAAKPIEPGSVVEGRTRYGHSSKVIEASKKLVLSLEAPKATSA